MTNSSARRQDASDDCDRPTLHLPKNRPRLWVPDGAYQARLVAVEPFSNAHGERFVFAFQVAAGPYIGALLKYSAARKSSADSKLAGFLAELLGRAPTPAELEEGLGREHIGLTCRIIAAERRNRSDVKYSAVERVIRS